MDESNELKLCKNLASDAMDALDAQRCTAKAVRCNGRLATIQKRLKELEATSS